MKKGVSKPQAAAKAGKMSTTPRDFYAGLAMQGLLAANFHVSMNPGDPEDDLDVKLAERAYRIADAMLRVGAGRRKAR